jgi:hypothetical protein
VYSRTLSCASCWKTIYKTREVTVACPSTEGALALKQTSPSATSLSLQSFTKDILKTSVSTVSLRPIWLARRKSLSRTFQADRHAGRQYGFVWAAFAESVTCNVCDKSWLVALGAMVWLCGPAHRVAFTHSNMRLATASNLCALQPLNLAQTSMTQRMNGCLGVCMQLMHKLV